jgi:hypothetical protein
MPSRVTAVRLLAGLLLGVAAIAGLVLLARTATTPRVAPAPDPAVAGAPGPPAVAGGPAATTTSGPGASPPAGATPTAPATRSASDPCRLVTRAEAAAVLGRPIVNLQQRQGFLMRSCLFSSDRIGRQVIVQLHQGPAASREQFRMSRRPDDQPVAGVGDEAWFTPDTGLLDVLVRTARFQVGLLDATGRPAQRRVPPGLLTLARAIAGRVR